MFLKSVTKTEDPPKCNKCYTFFEGFPLLGQLSLGGAFVIKQSSS